MVVNLQPFYKHLTIYHLFGNKFFTYSSHNGVPIVIMCYPVIFVTYEIFATFPTFCGLAPFLYRQFYTISTSLFLPPLRLLEAESLS